MFPNIGWVKSLTNNSSIYFRQTSSVWNRSTNRASVITDADPIAGGQRGIRVVKWITWRNPKQLVWDLLAHPRFAETWRCRTQRVREH